MFADEPVQAVQRGGGRVVTAVPLAASAEHRRRRAPPRPPASAPAAAGRHGRLVARAAGVRRRTRSRARARHLGRRARRDLPRSASRRAASRAGWSCRCRPAPRAPPPAPRPSGGVRGQLAEAIELVVTLEQLVRRRRPEPTRPDPTCGRGHTGGQLGDDAGRRRIALTPPTDWPAYSDIASIAPVEPSVGGIDPKRGTGSRIPPSTTSPAVSLSKVSAWREREAARAAWSRPDRRR